MAILPRYNTSTSIQVATDGSFAGRINGVEFGRTTSADLVTLLTNHPYVTTQELADIKATFSIS